MSGEIKTENVEDEENLKTTPVRATLPDNKNVQAQSGEEPEIQPQTQPTDTKDVIDPPKDGDGEIDVKTEPNLESNDNNETTTQEKLNDLIIEISVAGPTIVQEEAPKTQDKTTKEDNGVNGVREPLGRKQLFANDSNELNVTIGTFKVQVEASINDKERETIMESQNIKKKEGSTNQLDQLEAELQEISGEPELQERINETPKDNELQAMLEDNSNYSEISQEPTETQTAITAEIANVKIESSLDTQEPMDTTIANEVPEELNTEQENIIPEETPQIAVKTEPTGVDVDGNFIRPSNISREAEHTSATSISSSRVRDSIDGTATPIYRDTIDGTATPIVRYAAPRYMDANDGTATPRIRDAIDGTATPRISVASMSRLRVKTEFTLNQPTQTEQETSTIPNEFFEDLLDVNCESGELTPTNSDDRSEDGHIPDHFFDDLLKDKHKENIEEAINNDLEEKYSDRLKVLENLTKEERKKQKKQKKAKKKSRKRSRSKSPVPVEKRAERIRRSPSPNHRKNKRSRMSPPPPPVLSRQQSSSSSYGHLNKVNTDCVPSTSHSSLKSLQVKSEFRTFDNSNEASVSQDFNEDVEMRTQPVKVEAPMIICEDVEEIEFKEILTPKQKKEKAIKRASSLLSHLKNMSSTENSSILSTFQFTSTVRKLPTSHSYVQQRIYENRSPLHTVNNVNYKFNSHSTRFNLEEWGLASLPTRAAKIAKLVGCDALTIHNKLKTIKIPSKLQKVKNELNEQEEGLFETTSSYFCNAMTQTDEVQELVQHKTQGYEIGIQVEPEICNVGTQTLETQSPTKNNQRDAAEELPIMKIMQNLNENQLMAIHDFAELIKEEATNALDMYSLRVRMVEIYKCSQIPSALEAPQPQVTNNYTTSSSRNSPQTQRSSTPVIKSVRGADGSQFSVNDPRARSAAYSNRIGSSSSSGGNGIGSSVASFTNYDSRFAALPQPSNRHSSSAESRSYSSNSPSSRQRPASNQPQQQQQPPPTSSSIKYFGRGGLRR